MRSAAAALALLTIPIAIFSQDHATAPNEQFNFAGTVALRLHTDSMTDKSSCIASITSDLVGVDVTGTKAALLQTPSDIDYDQPAFLRIDEESPIALNVQRQKHHLLLRGSGTRAILIPLQRTPEFINALYTRRRIRLRYAVFPGPDKFDGEIKFGDFAAAYDRGVQLCAWPKLRATPVHPSEADLAALMFPGVVDDAPAAAASDDLGWYLNAAARRINTSLRSHGEGSTAFVIDKSGSVGSLSPGNSDADRACVTAVIASNPLPPLPSSRAENLAVRAQCSSNSVTLSRLD